MVVKPSGSSITPVRPLLLNALAPMLVRLLGSAMLCSDEQPLKALCWIDVMLPRKLTLSSCEQFKKMFIGTEVMVAGNSMLLRWLQQLNAPEPIVAILLPSSKITSSMPEQPMKQLWAMSSSSPPSTSCLIVV